MSRSRKSDQLALFRDAPGGAPPPKARPWRQTPADAWKERPPSAAAVEQQYPDLLRRDLQFLAALERQSVATTTSPAAVRFRERHEELIGQLVRWRADGVDTESARLARQAAGELAELRQRVLEGLESDRLQDVLASEPRIRIRDVEIERAVRMAEFELAEERGELVEIEVPILDARDPSPHSGLIGPGMIDPLVRAYLQDMRAEQERRALPARGGLGTLLRNTPVVWLDAISQALDLGATPTAHRKERERLIANRLIDAAFLRHVVRERLADDERRLLAFLLERGGKASAAAVTRRFGSDREDGWFWNEEPPTSVLGRVRLHGLVFVGAAAEGRGSRTVLVPRELMDGLAEALATFAQAPATVLDAGGEENGGEGGSAPGLRADVADALERAFPNGVIEPVWDDDIDDLQTALRRELTRIRGARLLYERTVDGAERWISGVPPVPGARTAWVVERSDEEDDWDEEDPDHAEAWDDMERSYGVLFLSPDGGEFVFEIEGEIIDEDGKPHPTAGHGRIGFAVAVSAVAPFALLRVTSLDSEEGYGASRPDIELRYFDDAGTPQPEDAFLLEGLGEEAKNNLEDLRQRIVRVLEESGIAVLVYEDVCQPVVWLQTGDGVMAGITGTPPTVEDALFFKHLG